MDIQKIVTEFKKAPPNSKLYLGSDSSRFKKGKQNFARISVVAVVHMACSKGCRVLGYNTVERVYDNNPGKPAHRMMLEVYEVSRLCTQLQAELPNVDIEVHLDINPDERYGSSCVASQAKGYVQGVCQVTPVLKPNAWAASTCADLFTKKLL